MINQRIKHLSGELQLQSATVSYLADIISGDLFQIAKARLLCKEPHPYFEAMFEIYKNQGLPVGWSGASLPVRGNLSSIPALQLLAHQDQLLVEISLAPPYTR